MPWIMISVVMAPLQRRLEGGLRQTMSVLLGSEVSELGLGTGKAPHVLWRSGHQGCSDGLCGTGNVLVGCRLAQGGNDEHMRSTEQTDTRGAS